MSPNSGGVYNHTSNSSGITHTIRNHLDFKDDKKWKEFSNRRLELIDKFNLSSRKASEQDDDIKQIADLLRTEFGFPVDTLGDFDKLVRAAIQSVRRNRKRSSRARVNNDRFVMVDDQTKQPSPSPIPNNNNAFHSLMNHGSHLNLLQPQTLFGTTSTSNSLATSPQNLLPSIKNITSSNPPTISTSPPNQIPISNTNINNVNSNNSGINNSNNNNSIGSSSSKLKSSFELSSSSKQKLLNFIQKSKTCLLLSNNDPSIHGDNLMNLGKSILSSSISFVLERFFSDIPADSINYLYEKLNTNLNFSRILKNLGYLSNDILILSDLQASNLLCKLIGCCVKDFGFDSIGYTLGEIFHEIILNEYPLISTQITKLTQESLYTPLLPIIPQEADNEMVKDVQLRYGSKILDFKFTPLSSAPPTYLELVENGKIGFGIDKSKNIRLRWNNKELLDIEISKIFKDLSIKKIDIELYDLEKKDNNLNFTRLL